MHIRLNKGILKGVLCFFVLALLGILIFQLLIYWNGSVGKVSSIDKNQVYNDGRIMIDGSWYIPKKNIKTILVAGIDKFEEQVSDGMYLNNQQADFLMLLVIDESKDICRVVSINRDTMTTIQRFGAMGEKTDKFIGQIALSHAYGITATQSDRNMVDTVQNLLYGTKIDHYMTLTMDAVAEINDFMGGVTLICKDDLSSIHPELKKGAQVTLTGDMALSYVRSRAGLEDSTNLSRMERQKQYVQAVFQKLHDIEITGDSVYTELFDTLSNKMTSDCTINQMEKIYNSVINCENIGFEAIEGETRDGEEYVEFYPDEEKLLELVTRLFYNKEK